MKTAFYFVKHAESKSVYCVEFAYVKGKFKIIGSGFAKGNVCNLGAYRRCREEAKKYLATVWD